MIAAVREEADAGVKQLLRKNRPGVFGECGGAAVVGGAGQQLGGEGPAVTVAGL